MSPPQEPGFWYLNRVDRDFGHGAGASKEVNSFFINYVIWVRCIQHTPTGI